MYIPATSGHQKHTINNFILGELTRYVRFNTQKKNFLKIKRKFFVRLRNRGYKKVFLARLFKKVKYGTRNKLLAISADNENYRGIGNDRSDTSLVNDAERMFQQTFSEEEIPMENNLNLNVHTVCVPSPLSVFCDSKVGCYIILPVKNIKRRYKHYCCLCSSFFLFQEEEDFNQVNLVIPGSLLPLKTEVVNIFEKEKQKLFRKERFAKVFKNISISAIFLNRKNLKNW